MYVSKLHNNASSISLCLLILQVQLTMYPQDRRKIEAQALAYLSAVVGRKRAIKK